MNEEQTTVFISDVDQYLFGQGTHYDIYKKLGAHVCHGMPTTDVTVNNGKIDVSIYELDPVVVTKENEKEVFANDPDRMALLK